MSNQIGLSGFVCRAFAFTAVFGAATVLAGAQTVAATAPTVTAPVLNLSAPVMESSSDQEFTTSAPANEVAVASHLDFLGAMNAMQYGGRRTGRPRYRGGNTNADGSKKYEFYGGVGFQQPVGNTYHYLSPSWGIQVGAGRNMNAHVGVDVQFDYDHFGMNGRTVGNQLNLYNSILNYLGDGADDFTTLNGNSHDWSFTVDPKYTLTTGGPVGAYLVVGFGFFHKVANFTVPTEEEYCDYIYGCYEIGANQTVDHYTSNAPGVNPGFGLTYKFSRFSNEMFYAEARYVYTFNSQRQGATINNFSSNPGYYSQIANDYPANSNRTSYIPIKFGIRF